VQEHGISSSDLLTALSERGAEVFPVRVYQWALPDDVAPIEEAVIRRVCTRDTDFHRFPFVEVIDPMQS